MATNRNKNTGNISAPQGANKNKGITSAIDQAGYRREFNERVFSDTGYIQSSIKDLQEQVSELEIVLSKSKELAKSEQTRYKNAVSNMKRLESQLQQIYKSQDVSSNELFSTLNDSIKARQKAVDDLYKHYMNNEKELDKAGKEFVDKKIDYFAAKTRELKGATEEIKEASEKFNDSQKSFSDGMKEIIKEATNTFKDLTNMFNLQSIAQNKYLEKANERYDIINKMNSQLGYGTDAATSAYNNISQAFTDFNNQMDNLYNMNDMKQYLKDSSQYGLLNNELLEKNLNSTLMAQKYMGASSDTLTSLYKYSRLTNNNDTIEKYNKTMIALQKEGIGVNKDMLNNMIQSNVEVSDVLTAAGLSGETLDQFNQERTVLNAQIQYKYGPEYAKQINSLVDESIKKLATTEGEAQLAQMGIDPSSFKAEVSQGDAQGLYDMVIKGVTSRANSWNSDDWSANLKFFNQLGLNTSDINAARKINEGGEINGLGPVTEEVQEIIDNMNTTDTEQYVENNTAISDTQRTLNEFYTNYEEWMGSWDGFAKAGNAFFTLAIAGNIIQGVGSVAKFVNTLSGGKLAEKLSTAFGGKLSSVVNKFFGNSSTIGKSAANMTASGSGGKALGKLGAGATVVGLTAAAIAGISAAANAMTEGEHEAGSSNMQSFLNEQKGTKFEGDTGRAYASGMNQKIGTAESDNLTDAYTSYFSPINTAKNFLGQIANSLVGWTNKLNMDDPAKYNKELWNNYQRTIHGQFSEDRLRALEYTYALALDDVNQFSVAKDLFNIDAKSIVNWLNDEQLKGTLTQTLQDGVNLLAKNDLYPVGNNRQWWDGSIELNNWFDTNTGQFIEGYHKAGLERVPKDNYRALLHKNEMVLNEKDADEYREYKHNFEALRGAKDNKNKILLLPSNSKRGIGGKIAGIEVGDYNSSYVNGHSGLDLYFNKVGTPVGSAVAGTVITSKDIPVNYNDGKSYHGKDSSGKAYSSYGRYVEVKGDNGERYVYAHLNERVAKEGDVVQPGALLGYSGTTGNSSGPHLHFEVRGKGNNSAAHAKYYTDYVRNVNGAPSGTTGNSSESGTNTVNESDTHIKLATPTTTSRRAIPGIGGNDLTPEKEAKINGVDRIVNSVDGVSTKIIKYLDEIRQEQESQRSLIRAFSNSQNMLDMRN